MENGVFEKKQDFSNLRTDIKPIVLYQPQSCKSGDGLDNTVTARDTDKVRVLKERAALARDHGIHAFGVYYYQLSSGVQLEQPIDILSDHSEIDFPFFLIWHCEDRGLHTNDNPAVFISNIKKYIDDSRYMRIEGKPVVGIYNPHHIPDVATILSSWRAAAETAGLSQILIWSFSDGQTAEDAKATALIDGEYVFPAVNSNPRKGTVLNYPELAERSRFCCMDSKKHLFQGIILPQTHPTPGGLPAPVWSGYTHELFYQWNRTVINYVRTYFPEDQRFIFINVWSNWNTHTNMMQDQSSGHAGIHALSRAIFDLPYSENTYITTGHGFYKQPGWDQDLANNAKIAVQIHLFYTELIPDLFSKLANIQHPFDLYVTTNAAYKAACFRHMYADARMLHHNVQNVHIDICVNKGRDVIPFMRQMFPVHHQYKYICHIHTKKSTHNDFGNLWRDYLYDNLLGSQAIVDDILYMLETDPSVGIVYPKTLPESEPYMHWGLNKDTCFQLADAINIKQTLEAERESTRLAFPAGNMFWIRTAAAAPLLGYQISETDIPPEAGQIDGTIMHAVERLWCYVAKDTGYRAVQVCNPFGSECPYALIYELNTIKKYYLWPLAKKAEKIIAALLPDGSPLRRFLKKIYCLVLGKGR